MSDAERNCTRCGELLPADAFYFVSRASGRRRGQCKACMAEIKAAQKEPDWLPMCARCGRERPRSGPGRRLCTECFDAIYDAEDRRPNGSHRNKLNPCPVCGAKRLRADHDAGTQLCPVCRSVTANRRKRLVAFFNLTPGDYWALLDYQGHACAICGRSARSGAPLHIDHHHGEPRLVRGAICGTCNSLIGMARERIEVLRSAIAYLESPPAQEMFPGREAHVEANRPGQPWMKLARVRA